MGRLVALAALAAALLGTSSASAYCLASTCDDQGAVCFPPQPTDCGRNLRWFRGCIGYAVQTDASVQVDRATTRSALRAAFDAWEAARCADGTPSIHAEDLKPVECDTVEYNENAGNVNLIVFRDLVWSHPDTPDHIALTTVTFDIETGEILDADIEINTAQHDLITPTAAGEFELLAVLTHEVGHFLGIAHSPLSDATMFASYSSDLATLAPDDEQAICSIYTPKADVSCNPIPRHGFSPDCSGDQTEGDCSAAPPGTSRRSGASALAALALGAALQRLRRRPGAPSWLARRRRARS